MTMCEMVQNISWAILALIGIASDIASRNAMVYNVAVVVERITG